MKRRKLFWRIYPYYFIIIVVALALTAFYGAREMKAMYLDELTTNLETQARIAERLLRPLLTADDVARLDHECKEIADLSNIRITTIAADGVVLGDSDEDPLTMENHGSRPEIVQATLGEVGMTTRYSNTLQTTMLYVAIPVFADNEVVAVVRAAVPISAVEDTLTSFYEGIVISGVLIVVLAALVSLVVLRRLTDPLRELRDGAGRFADGDLGTRLTVPDTEEIADLSESMNSMAAQLDARIHMIAEQRNELEAILSSMSEGVLALDRDERIVSLNRMAADMLGLDPEQSRGKVIHEVARIPSLLGFVEKALYTSDTTEMEIDLPGQDERYLQVRCAVLRNGAGEGVGIVLVFNDISRLKKLESIRRDFVANVSHELRTPITAITGSVETLLGGAQNNPDDSKRFLEMIARNSDRLNSLVDDLLSLARLESEAESDEVELTRTRLSDVLQASIQACQETARLRQVVVTCSCDDRTEANLNPSQFELAICNLIDNAIKYSEPGSSVAVEAITSGEELVVSVQDHGMGIAAEHLPRLFERFYRVEKSRSREAGGTGLGLAIVKHVVGAHGGQVAVDSTPGQGSTFRIHLPGQP